VWELHCLFAFCNSPALDIRSIIPSGPLTKPLYKAIEEFDVNEAHCFDPNEELRLKYITGGGGVGDNTAFNEKIRHLASRLTGSVKRCSKNHKALKEPDAKALSSSSNASNINIVDMETETEKGEEGELHVEDIEKAAG
jgi:hypothetical protein